MSRNINEIVAGQFPEFIRSTQDYAKFIEFIEDYYKFEESLDIIEEADIDKTHFLEHYFGELAKDFPQLRSLSDKKQRLVLQKLSDLYKSKGSLDSYKALFAILFSIDVELFYPSTEIFKPSAARWNREVSVRFEVTSGEVITLENLTCEINTTHRKYDLDIDRIKKLTDTLYEAIFNIKFKLVIPDGGTITTNEFTGKLIQGINSYEVRVPGAGFNVGDIFDVENNLGSGTRIRIKRVHSGGGIRNLEIFQFGTGYQNSFFHILNPESALIITELNNLTITVTGTDPSSAAYPTDDKVNNIGDNLQATRFDYTVIHPTDRSSDYFQDNTYVGEQVAEASTISTQIQEENVNRAVVFFKLGYVHEYPGYFSTNVGFPDDSSYIQDGHYYQQYSYLIKSTKQFKDYKKPVLDLLHPAGLKAFGEYRIERNLEVLINVRNELNRFANNLLEVLNLEETISKTIVKDLMNDNVDALEQIALSLEKYQEDSVDIEDESIKVITKNIYDTITVVDGFDPDSSISIGVIDTYNENITVSELTVKSQSKAISDAINAIDEIILTVAKVVSDEVEITDDVINLVLTKSVNEVITPEEFVAKTISKSLNESTSFQLVDGEGDSLGIGTGDELVAYSTIEEHVAKTVYKSFADSVTVSDDIVDLLTLTLRTATDDANVDDEILLTITKNIDEIIDALDEYVKVMTKTLVDSVTTNETINKTYNTTKSESVSANNYGVVMLEPFYYDPSLGQYWEAGYAENEREIT